MTIQNYIDENCIIILYIKRYFLNQIEELLSQKRYLVTKEETPIKRDTNKKETPYQMIWQFLPERWIFLNEYGVHLKRNSSS